LGRLDAFPVTGVSSGYCKQAACLALGSATLQNAFQPQVIIRR
jgi:hypothetical protein